MTICAELDGCKTCALLVETSWESGADADGDSDEEDTTPTAEELEACEENIAIGEDVGAIEADEGLAEAIDELEGDPGVEVTVEEPNTLLVLATEEEPTDVLLCAIDEAVDDATLDEPEVVDGARYWPELDKFVVVEGAPLLDPGELEPMLLDATADELVGDAVKLLGAENELVDNASELEVLVCAEDDEDCSEELDDKELLVCMLDDDTVVVAGTTAVELE